MRKKIKLQISINVKSTLVNIWLLVQPETVTIHKMCGPVGELSPSNENAKALWCISKTVILTESETVNPLYAHNIIVLSMGTSKILKM